MTNLLQLLRSDASECSIEIIFLMSEMVSYTICKLRYYPIKPKRFCLGAQRYYKYKEKERF